MLLFSSLHRTPSRFLHHSAYFCLPHPLSNSVTSPYVSHLNPPLSPPSLPLLPCQMPMIHVRSVYTSCCSLAFLPPSHSYLILTVFSVSLSHFPLLSPHRFSFFPHCFSSLPLRLSDNCLRRRHFYRCKTNGTGGGCDTHPCHPVTPPSSRREESSHLFFCSSFLRSIISSIPVK